VVVSQRGLKQGRLEVKVRRSGEVLFCSREELPALLEKIQADLMPEMDGLPFMPE
jgi:hypothetical protein